ncbi:MAG TPA: hypothetical protein PLV06_13920 [Bacteroidales bacterium]|nr:hypothetical protein [Bacteroidales bacterium]HPR13481.1 hypothetical protein [Bacteroidales bacterium]HRW86300.1 hypothetical protein [Bacteroidales bacterium]
MKKKLKILFFTVLLAFSATVCFSQAVTTIPGDTIQKITQNAGSEDNAQTQVQERNQNQARNQGAEQGQGNNQNANAKASAGAKGAGKVKQVKSARPDWSKAKGARPNIVRPAGSNIPKGVGKPAGAGRPGGR